MKSKLLQLSTFLAAFFGLAQFATAQYCTPTYSISCSTYQMTVNSFSTTGGSVNITNNNQGCSSGNGYTYYSTLGHTTSPASTVGYSVSVGPNYPVHVYIWVDYNADGDFYDSGELVASTSYVAASATWTGSFTIPGNAAVGTTRMRIRTLYYGSSGMHPCNNLPYGEAEDYNFSILPPYANDAGIAEILNPTVPTCDLDSVDISVAVQNLGSDTLQNCSIYYQVNTSTPVAMYYTGSVAPQGGLDTVTIGNVSFNNGDDLTVWTELPNGVTDSLSSNDEQSMVTSTGLTGTYAIPGDYATINDAADDLHTFGVCGDVVFNLATGTYNEQVTFNEILGTDENNTVTFKSASGNRNDVLIQYDASGSTDNYVVQFDGGDWITFKDLRMKALEQYTYGAVLSVKTGSDNNTIENCWLKGNSYQTTSNFSATIRWEGNSAGFTLSNSLVENGSASIYMVSGNTSSPSEDMTIQGNIIRNALYYQMYMYAIDGFILDDNTITNDSALYGGNYGYSQLYMYSVNNFDITKNYIGHDVGQSYYYPIYMNACIGRNNPRSQFSNNCIFQATPGATSYGYYTMYAPGSGIMDFHNNSITRRGGYSNYPTLYIANGGLISMKNNSIANLSSGYALQVAGGFSISESDYNNIYTASGSPVYFGTSQYSTLEAYQNATGNDMNSVQTDPNFETSLTCITCNDTLSNAGQVLANNTEDISGNVRSVLHPDIGAVEFVDPGSFTLGGDDTICGSEAIIEAGPAQSVTWNVNNQTSTQSSVTLTATNEPVTYNISVSITTEYCGSGSDNAIIRLIPDATLDSASHICSDETLDLEPGGGSGATFSWSTGENTSSITVAEAGTYSVNKMEDGCESEATIVITQSQGVEIADLDACEADLPISIDASIMNGTSYAWSGGSSINTASNDFSDAGTYSVTATDSYGCFSSDDFGLTVLEEPTAAITETHTGNAYFFDGTSSLFISQSTSYLWDFGYNGQTATTPTASIVYPWSDPSALATYTVTLSIDNGCGTDVDQMNITPDQLGIDAIAEGSFGLYPNPATDNVNFVLSAAAPSQGTVQVLDLAGRTLSSQIISAGQWTGELDVTGLASGSYLVKVIVDDNSSVNTLIKQ
jgi:hypothetical protein